MTTLGLLHSLSVVLVLGLAAADQGLKSGGLLLQGHIQGSELPDQVFRHFERGDLEDAVPAKALRQFHI